MRKWFLLFATVISAASVSLYCAVDNEYVVSCRFSCAYHSDERKEDECWRVRGALNRFRKERSISELKEEFIQLYAGSSCRFEGLDDALLSWMSDVACDTNQIPEVTFKVCSHDSKLAELVVEFYVSAFDEWLKRRNMIVVEKHTAKERFLIDCAKRSGKTPDPNVICFIEDAQNRLEKECLRVMGKGKVRIEKSVKRWPW